MNQINITGISCGVFRKELEYLSSCSKIEIKFEFITSLLHLKPELLKKKLDKTVNRELRCGYVLVFGDCHPKMNEYDSLPNVKRVCGVNCCEIFLGKKSYKQLRSEGFFILHPEWVPKYKDIFIRRFGFNSTNIKDFMSDMHKGIKYLDTGITQVPHTQLDSIADFTGLKVDVVKIDLCFLADAVNNAYFKLREKLDEL